MSLARAHARAVRRRHRYCRPRLHAIGLEHHKENARNGCTRSSVGLRSTYSPHRPCETPTSFQSASLGITTAAAAAVGPTSFHRGPAAGRTSLLGAQNNLMIL
ncbi:hypothetical protein IWZ03DRAFT_419671, partial [Phyllosticta citriasiana]